MIATERRRSVLDGLAKAVRAAVLNAHGHDRRVAERWLAGLRPRQRELFTLRAACILEWEGRLARVARRVAEWVARHPRYVRGGPPTRGVAKAFPFAKFGLSKSTAYAWRGVCRACGLLSLARDGRGLATRGRIGPKIRLDGRLFRRFKTMMAQGIGFMAAWRCCAEQAENGGLVWAGRDTVRRRYDAAMNPRREG